MGWTPPEREPWVDKLNAYGRGLGDDGRSLVSLRAEDLLAASRSAPGLDDAGDDWFREPRDRLCAALDDEAELHLAGRIRARAELRGDGPHGGGPRRASRGSMRSTEASPAERRRAGSRGLGSPGRTCHDKAATTSRIPAL